MPVSSIILLEVETNLLSVDFTVELGGLGG